MIFLMMSLMSTAWADTLKIRIWSGWPPGGPVDQQIRLLQKYLSQAPNTQVIVEYKTGASGVIGLNHFVSLEPNEYVELLLDASGIMITGLITRAHSVDITKDLRILAPIGHTQMLLLSSKASGLKSIADLRDTTKKSIIYASSGMASISHFTTAYLNNYIDQELVHVPYKGTNAVYPDLFEGRVDMFSVLANDGIEHLLSNKVSAIGITGRTRHPRLPHVPTLEEQGIRNYPIDPWFAVFAHPRNDPSRLLQTQLIIRGILNNHANQRAYLDQGIMVSKTGIQDPNKWLSDQLAVYRTLAKDPRFANLSGQ